MKYLYFHFFKVDSLLFYPTVVLALGRIQGFFLIVQFITPAEIKKKYFYTSGTIRKGVNFNIFQMKIIIKYDSIPISRR